MPDFRGKWVLHLANGTIMISNKFRIVLFDHQKRVYTFVTHTFDIMMAEVQSLYTMGSNKKLPDTNVPRSLKWWLIFFEDSFKNANG